MTFTERMIGAAKLDARAYEEVEADRTATPQALAVVVLSTLAGGVGALRFGALGPSLFAGLIGALAGWIIWAAVSYMIGVYLLPEPATRADIGELLRTIGFATSPGILRIFAFVPILGRLLLLVVSIWLVMTMVVAIRQALDYESTLRAVAVCVAGWFISLVVLTVFGAMFFVSAHSLLF
ncbi:MAG TPA: YIP1 family protein [Vicinamibacterales bacterium]|jgi:hypothetical protein|nr:YIP1 family protein [Vicinamibacterales bacterium]